jgi:hypothetical protein
MSSTFDPSLILQVLVLLLKLVATVRTHIILGGEILATLRTGKGELSSARGANLIVSIQGAAAVRAEIDTTGGAFVIVLADRLAAIATKGSSLNFGTRFYLFSRFSTFVLKPLLKLSTTMRAEGLLGRDLLITHGAKEAELGPALGTDGIVGIHLGSALGTESLLLVNVVDRLIVNQICSHDAPRFWIGSFLDGQVASPFAVRESARAKEKGCHTRRQPDFGSFADLSLA